MRANLQEYIPYLEQATQARADIIVFPELGLSQNLLLNEFITTYSLEMDLHSMFALVIISFQQTRYFC